MVKNTSCIKKPTNWLFDIRENTSIRNYRNVFEERSVFILAKLLKSKKDLEFYLEDFMEYCSIKELSKKTINSYESTLMLF